MDPSALDFLQRKNFLINQMISKRQRPYLIILISRHLSPQCTGKVSKFVSSLVLFGSGTNHCQPLVAFRVGWSDPSIHQGQVRKFTGTREASARGDGARNAWSRCAGASPSSGAPDGEHRDRDGQQRIHDCLCPGRNGSRHSGGQPRRDTLQAA